ncbi:MAG TPA: HDOD domain-containing protein [Candidatus Acidoferrales bacterium]|nr:HDOD domain-containing protein [Candidatus Acidoferrales bacterium]
MTSSVRPANPPPPPPFRSQSPFAAEALERRKKRLTSILSQGLPTLPHYILDLTALLNKPSVDLKKVSNVIRTDPSLSAQVLRLCNSALFGLRRRVLSIEQAAILLGTERLRTLVLTCSVMQFAGKYLPKDQLMAFWQHSFLSALLSERIARQVDYFEKEQAYLGGLLHDIGQLPLWMLVIEETNRQRELPPQSWIDQPEIERDYFGLDHCKVGRQMAIAWNFMPSFVDVFECHHSPERAQHDPYLVGIVAAADQFLQTQEVLPPPNPEDAAPPEPVAPVDHPPVDPPFLQRSLPQLSETERAAIMEMLQTEYIHLLPLVQLGLAAATGAMAEQK